MRWEQLEVLTAEDPRWRVHAVHTAAAAPKAAADVLEWIERERASGSQRSSHVRQPEAPGRPHD